MNVLRIGGGLLLLIAANIALGSAGAVLRREWRAEIFFKGIVKGLVVTAAFSMVFLAGALNPDLVVIQTESASLDLSSAVYLVLLSGFVFYAGKVLIKLKDTIMASYRSEKKEKGEGSGNKEDVKKE